jgi:hypothetical protein
LSGTGVGTGAGGRELLSVVCCCEGVKVEVTFDTACEMLEQADKVNPTTSATVHHTANMDLCFMLELSDTLVYQRQSVANMKQPCGRFY